MNNYTNILENPNTSEKLIVKTEPLEWDISTNDQDINNIPVRIKQERSPSPVDHSIQFQTSSFLSAKPLIDDVTPNLVDGFWGSAKRESPVNECAPSSISVITNVGRTFFLEDTPENVYTSNGIPKGTTQCHICSKTFFKRRMLVKHYKDAHNSYTAQIRVMKNTCKECGHYSRRGKKLRKHYRVHHPNKLFLCDVCSQDFPEITAFKKHYQRHIGNRNRWKKKQLHHRALQTSLETRSIGNVDDVTPKLVYHAWGSANSESLVNECAPNFISVTNNVETSFREEKPVNIKTSDDIPKRTKKCNICCEFFPKKSLLLEHYYKAHNFLRSTSKNTCKECGHYTRKYKKLRKHYRIYHPNKLITCDVCLDGFLTIENLKAHYKHHIGNSTREWYKPVFENPTSNMASLINDEKYPAVPTVESEPTHVY